MSEELLILMNLIWDDIDPRMVAKGNEIYNSTVSEIEKIYLLKILLETRYAVKSLTKNSSTRADE